MSWGPPKPKPRPPPVFRPPPPHWQLLPSPANPDGSPSTIPIYMRLLTKTVYREYPSPEVIAYETEKYRQATVVDVNEIIAKARAEAEAQALAAAQKAATEKANAEALQAAADQAKQAKKQHKSTSSKDKRIYKLFGKVVVSTMNSYKKYLDSDQFKRRAKEVCNIMCEKEKRSSHYATDNYDSLSPERERKLRNFVKEFIQKLLARKGIKVSSSSSSSSTPAKLAASHQQATGSATPQSTSSKASTSAASPEQKDGGDGDGIDMDLDDDDDEDDDDAMFQRLVDDAANTTPDSAKTPQTFGVWSGSCCVRSSRPSAHS